MSAFFLTQELEVLSHEMLAVLSRQGVNSTLRWRKRGPLLPPGDSLWLESQDLVKRVVSRLSTCPFVDNRDQEQRAVSVLTF